ncbi:MAG TPA: hypothetical protein VKL19_11925 [Thermoanaerobaculia bacterium]|nr:hypothetical protein [Thermoanaerobaculia bacterium]
MSRYFLIAGGVIFCLLGLLHAIFTLGDIARPRRLAPSDPELVARMRSSGLRLSRDRTNMWDAWLGFNLSHSLGAILFGVVCINVTSKSWLAFLAMVSVIYLVLAIRFWFNLPAIAIATATACLLIAWVTW